MKIINIIGGLGNQMFQYAFGKELEYRLGEQIFYNTSWYEKYPLHNGFELERLFKCLIPRAEKDAVRKLSTTPDSLFNRMRRKYATKKTHFIDRHFTYDEKVFSLTGNVFYDGFWQSANYFENVKYTIIEDFNFKIQLNSKSADLEKRIGMCKSISIHIRRGDYLKSENLNVCTPEYYQNATQKVHELTVKKTSNLFCVFSDDIGWCKNNLDLDPEKTVFVNWNSGSESWQDMYLMSKCNHNIIANSSFSWWGAYLNKNPEKIVIVPEIWNMREVNKKDKYYDFKFNSVVPQSWLRVKI